MSVANMIVYPEGLISLRGGREKLSRTSHHYNCATDNMHLRVETKKKKVAAEAQTTCNVQSASQQ